MGTGHHEVGDEAPGAKCDTVVPHPGRFSPKQPKTILINGLNDVYF